MSDGVLRDLIEDLNLIHKKVRDRKIELKLCCRWSCYAKPQAGRRMCVAHAQKANAYKKKSDIKKKANRAASNDAR